MIFTTAFLGAETSPGAQFPKPAAEMEPDFVGETLVERPEGEKGKQESRGVILGEGIYGMEGNSHETSREPFQMWLLTKGWWEAQWDRTLHTQNPSFQGLQTLRHWH